MASPSLRIYLTGRLALESGAALIDDRQFPGRQGRLVFAYLVCERARPVGRGELIEILWEERPPDDSETALSAIVSKLRHLLRSVERRGSNTGISAERGQHQLLLPADAWVDLEAATAAIDEAEGAIRAKSWPRAWGAGNVAAAIARRPFLPAEEAGWIERRRRELREVLVRAILCLGDAALETGQHPLAVQHAAEAVALEPFRDTGYQRLMRAHAVMGNRAEALRVYARCREILRDELGTSPSPDTEALYLKLLRA